MLIDPRYLFATDVRVSREDQLALIARGRANGFQYTGLYGGKTTVPFWRLEVVRSVDQGTGPRGDAPLVRHQGASGPELRAVGVSNAGSMTP